MALPSNSTRFGSLSWLKDTVRDTAVRRTNIKRKNEFVLAGIRLSCDHGLFVERKRSRELVGDGFMYGQEQAAKKDFRGPLAPSYLSATASCSSSFMHEFFGESPLPRILHVPFRAAYSNLTWTRLRTLLSGGPGGWLNVQRSTMMHDGRGWNKPIDVSAEERHYKTKMVTITEVQAPQLRLIQM